MSFTNTLELRPHHIQEAITASSGQASLSQTLTDYVAFIKSTQGGLGRQYSCPHCMEVGRYAKSVDTGDSGDTALVDCPTCDGYGFTTVQYVKYGAQYKPQ